MRGFLLLLALAFLLVLPPFSSAATIHGNVYDIELNLVRAVVGINTTPKQQMVAVDGKYSFEVPRGSYIISVRVKGTELVAEELINVAGEGSYVLDLILLPSLAEEEELLNETGLRIESPFDEPPAKGFPATVIALVIALLALAVFLALRHFARKEKVIVREKVIIKQEPRMPRLDDDAQAVVDFIKKEGGRTTQKDLRKNFPFSEAKMSLIISDLEDKKIIRKIKKGRGNVIVLEKRG